MSNSGTLPESVAESETGEGKPTPSAEEEAPVNALRDNIAKKGQNSYYYAHTKTSEPLYNFGGQPRKLSLKEDDPELASKSSKRQEKISKYSWADGKKSVQIYIEHEGIDEIDEDKLLLDWEAGSFKFVIQGDTTEHTLHVPKLYDDIKSAKIKRKGNNRISVILFKTKEFTWYKLTSK